MLALLYDVHGNLPALEAVLADAHERGVGRFLLGGDYAAFGAWPAETVARLDELQDATWIRGNWERWLADPAEIPVDGPPAGAAQATIDALGPELIQRLVALPPTALLEDTLFCHASPQSDTDIVLPAPQPGDAELFAGVEQERVVMGHTHIQFRRTLPAGIEIVNPGSVGLPFDGDRRAAYGLIAADGTIELRRVDYDVEHAIATLRARGESWADKMAVVLERASL